MEIESEDQDVVGTEKRKSEMQVSWHFGALERGKAFKFEFRYLEEGSLLSFRSTSCPFLPSSVCRKLGCFVLLFLVELK